MVKFLNSLLVKFIIKSTKWSNFETCKEIFNFIEYPLLDKYNDNNIFKFYEISEDEIKYIENIIF